MLISSLDAYNSLKKDYQKHLLKTPWMVQSSKYPKRYWYGTSRTDETGTLLRNLCIEKQENGEYLIDWINNLLAYK